MPAVQTDDASEFQRRASSDFWFACVDLEVIKDKTLSTCDKAVFAVICAHVNVQTRSCPLRVKTIAEEANCCVRRVQESLKALAERGVIERVECFENGKQKASVYKIVGHRALCYRDAESAGSAKSPISRGAEAAPISQFCPSGGAEDDGLSLREPNIYKKKEKEKDYSPSEREASLPPDDRYRNDRCADDDLIAPGDAFAFGDVPTVMRETLDYFLLKTGRVGISPEELSALRALEEIHTPSRVNREIAEAVERFRKKNRPLSELTLVYIYRSLQYQSSLKDKAPPRRGTKEKEAPDPYEGAYL
ncbi:MAG: helix-turn-helix domain-containing protein [Synergistaceae bacterium]|jgi:hypothetical protein|nr:helix-turn-helix domain-containing protein [Synergistaceae bacterium]